MSVAIEEKSRGVYPINRTQSVPGRIGEFSAWLVLDAQWVRVLSHPNIDEVCRHLKSEGDRLGVPTVCRQVRQDRQLPLK